MHWVSEQGVGFLPLVLFIIKMKKTIITREITQYVKKCPICKKEIKGNSESQVEYNLKFHIERRHGGENDK